MAERQFGPYRLVRQIAVGGMAEIHLAKTKGIAGFEKYVALKMIHPNFAEDDQFIQMLVDEAKIAVQLNHGNIAQTFDLGRVGDTYYITMEYVDGADLYKLLRTGSEMEIEVPLDVCAFVGKEIASALDHAHRKKDHLGKTLGIVHRDVSPQNVLISYAGEVKLVDFGIAKATMKARQTAAGVIKGKYYYMSPEQAWGEVIDYRSDIFSAGIVIYEMMTGQMLYLEEDLHRLLDMARKADIASPTTLRKGIPPQLERIVMRALAKKKEDRYQSAADFATDLERFLHAYSPVFTAAKLSNLLKKIVGDPEAEPDMQVEMRDGVTGTLNPEEVIHDSSELRDENSVIFRVADLKPKQPEAAARKPTGIPANRVTRQADIKDLGAPPSRKVPTPPSGGAKLPSIAPVKAMPRAVSKPRDADEATREVGPAPPDPHVEDSGLLDVAPPRAPSQAMLDNMQTPPMEASAWSGETLTGAVHDAHDVDHGGEPEHTMITGAPGHMGPYMDVAGEDGGEATMISSGPPAPDDGGSDDDDDDAPTLGGDDDEGEGDGDGPTIQRDFRERNTKTPSKRAPAPAALAAKIHAPAVSELKKPRPSRKTPGEGLPAQPNVLQQIVGAQPSEPMPQPMPPRPQPMVPAARAHEQTQPPPFMETPPVGQQMQPAPNVPPHLQPYAMQHGGFPQGAPPPYQSPQHQGYPVYPNPQQQNAQTHNYPQMSPQALYQLQPYGAAPPQPMSLTGQMRLFEVDELPSMYKVSGGTAKWLKLAIAAVLAVSVAAGVTFFIIKSRQDLAPSSGAIHVDSVPPGAEVSYDGTKLAGATPLTIDKVPLGTKHEIKVELAKHKAFVEEVDVPKTGGEVPVTAIMKPITGKLVIVTQPDGAEIRIDGQLRGRAPTTISDIDMTSAKTVELRLRDYQPFVQSLEWPANGEIDIDHKMQR